MGETLIFPNLPSFGTVEMELEEEDETHWKNIYMYKGLGIYLYIIKPSAKSPGVFQPSSWAHLDLTKQGKFQVGPI